ncbi:DUF771 domain-containing protein [Enterococcus faecalis]|uniref:DUF771 domain-containing protein n=1 Tax=Enterococcus faecalis TaxID=1351 RepID=UPI0025B0D9A6|nr:DUF771 domain-containing protein [Enterococcus faecalis]MDN3135994.1 DUF771 domain-containing protein [Enterococcus faecalis]
MFSQPEVPVQVNVQVDNQYLDKHLKEYVEQYCETFLRPEWYTMSDMEKITRHKRAWIMQNIVDDSYVKKNKLAKKESDSVNAQWVFDAERIRPFLKRLYIELPDYY